MPTDRGNAHASTHVGLREYVSAVSLPVLVSVSVCLSVSLCVSVFIVCVRARVSVCALSKWRHTHQAKRAIILYSLERSILQRRDALPNLALDRRLR